MILTRIANQMIMKFFLNHFFIIFLISPAWANDADIRFNFKKEFSPAENLAAQDFVQKVNEILPIKLKQKIKDNVIIEFKNLNKQKTVPIPCQEGNTKKFIYGLFKRRSKKIFIEQKLIEAFQNAESVTFNCKHGNLKNEAIATVVHELFHAYDYSKFTYESQHEGCPKFSTFFSQKEIKSLDRRCKKLFTQYKRKTKISDDLVFQNQIFWRNGGNSLLRTADPYENKNIREHAAINFEYFILDKNFKCRRPIYYAYFAKEFNHYPFQDYNCQAISKVVVRNYGKRSLIDIDPRTSLSSAISFSL